MPDTYGWGLNTASGVLGIASTSTPILTPTAVAVNGFIASRSINIGVGTAAALFLHQDGTVWFSGSNVVGHAGNGVASSSPVYSTPQQVSGLSNCVKVAVAAVSPSGAGYALDASGNLYGWGKNVYGELANGTTTPNYTPTVINTGVLDFDAGEGTVIVVKTTGVVQTAGNNSQGQLGNGTLAVSTTTWQTVTPGSNVVLQVAVGLHFTLLRMNNGTVMAAGFNPSNVNKALGATRGSGNFSTYFTISEYSSVVDIWTGGGLTDNGCSFVQKSDKTVWGMGYNASGFLGNASTTGTGTPQQLITPAGVVVVGTWRGWAASVMGFIGSDGHVYTWGDGSSGGMGNGGTTAVNSTPIDGTGLSGQAWVGGGGGQIWAGILGAAVPVTTGHSMPHGVFLGSAVATAVRGSSFVTIIG